MAEKKSKNATVAPAPAAPDNRKRALETALM